MKKLSVKVRRLYKDSKLPCYAHPGDAGMDLFSQKNYLIRSGQRKVLSTGVAIEIPSGYVSLIWDKSGLATKNGLKVLGGVIDSGYRGEYIVTLHNLSKKSYQVKKGDKIAQLLIQPVSHCKIIETKNLSQSIRGEKGFGSSGKR